MTRTSLSIYLGGKCNLNCNYCHSVGSIDVPFSDEFLKYVKKEGFSHINFFGGEPTLYMDKVRQIVNISPDSTFRITTNGVLLDKYIDYFKENKFLVCVSYDGQNLGERGFDPFTKVLDYPWLAVSCLIYHGNTDFNKILENFKEKESIIGRRLSFFPHIIHYTSESNKNLRLTKEDYSKVLIQFKSMIEEYVKDFLHGKKNVRYSGIFYSVLRRYIAGLSFGETWCVNSRCVKCDSLGTHYSCLYIRDERAEDINSNIVNKFPKCITCDVYDMCGAACVKSVEHGLECNFYYNLFSWFREFIEPYKELFDKNCDKYFYTKRD